MEKTTKAKLARLSRDRSFLIRFSLILSAISIAIALLASFAPATQAKLKEEMALLKHLFENDDEAPKSMEEWIIFLRIGFDGRGIYDLRDCRQLNTKRDDISTDPIEPEGIDGLNAELLHFLDLGLRLGDLDSGIAGLKALPETVRYRSEFLGDLAYVSRNYESAGIYYAEEANRFPDSEYSKRSAVVSVWASGNQIALKELLQDPVNHELFEPAELLDLFTDARDIGGLAKAVVRYEISEFVSPSLFPALFTATVWFLILMPFWQVTPQRITFSILAFVLGIVSAALTIFAVMLQERMQGFVHNPSDPPLVQVLYFIAGVSLREETLKLLCFLPLAIWAARKGRYLDGLILAALVGLGFAFKENLLYFDQGMASFTAWMRFLTANVLHFSLTGIAGFYLVKMIHRKFHGMEEFLLCFIIIVIAHGLYNSVIAVPSLASYSPLGTIFVAAMAYHFFDPLRSQMETAGIATRISPLGVFVIGSAVLACGLMITSAWSTPFRATLGIFASSVASLIPLAFAYISRFRDL